MGRDLASLIIDLETIATSSKEDFSTNFCANYNAYLKEYNLILKELQNQGHFDYLQPIEPVHDYIQPLQQAAYERSGKLAQNQQAKLREIHTATTALLKKLRVLLHQPINQTIEKNCLNLENKKSKNKSTDRINKLMTLIEEGKTLKNNAPRFGTTQIMNDSLRDSQTECHKWYTKTKSCISQIFGEKSEQLKLFMAHFDKEYTLTSVLGTNSMYIRYFYDNIGETICELEVFLEDYDETQVVVLNQVPFNHLFDEMNFHPKIVEISKALFCDGHYSEAILNSFIALNESVKKKAEIDIDGFALMNSVFSEEKPILKFNKLKTVTDKNEQKGFRFIFAGAMAGVRNPKAHKISAQKNPHHTLEYLALASLLFRRLDEAKK